MLRVITTFFLVLLTNCTLLATGSQKNGQGAKEMGIGAESASSALGASSLFYNPAATSFLGGTQLNLSFHAIDQQLRLRHRSGEVNEVGVGLGVAYGGYGFMSLKGKDGLGRLKLGFAVYNPHQADLDYGDDWVGRYLVQRFRLWTRYYQPTMSYRVNERIGLGFGLIYTTGGVESKWALPITTSDVGDENYSLGVKGNGNGFGFNLGCYMEPLDHFVIGINYRSRTRLKVWEGDGEIMADVPSSITAVYDTVEFNSLIRIPDVINVGFTYYFNQLQEEIALERRSFISFSISRTGWEQLEDWRFDFTEGLPNMGSRMEYKRRDLVTDNFTIGLGGQWNAVPLKRGWGLLLRGGVQRINSPAPTHTIMLESPDVNQTLVNGGLSFYPTPALSIDLSANYAMGKERIFDTEFENFSGTYNSNALTVGVGISVKL